MQNKRTVRVARLLGQPRRRGHAEAALLVAASWLGLSGCGEGPADSGEPNTEQGLPLASPEQPARANAQQTGTDYQRPLLDPQTVSAADPQRLPGVSGELANEGIAAGEDLCEQVCAPAADVECGGLCEQTCEAWRGAPASCLGVLERLVACVVDSQGDCAPRTATCVLEHVTAIEGCPSLTEERETDER